MSELAAYTLQSALLLAVGLALPALFRLRDARVRLVYLHGLLLATGDLRMATAGDPSSVGPAGGGAAGEGTSGDKDLDKAAIDTVSAWTFKPATLDGKPVEVYYTLTIRFALD